jgi:vanillate O-demethylase monooxygenase subunit
VTDEVSPFPPIWFVAGYAPDLRNAPQARRICDRPVLLFRTVSGVPIALEDRCSHRAMPLSKGECDGEIVRCPYHGLEFGSGGVCVRIPGQEYIPPEAAIRSYPLVEKNHLLWIWMDDPARADAKDIPDNPLMDDPGWEHFAYEIEVEADWQLVVDNLLDLTHLAYVHRGTVGAAEAEAATLKVSADGERVRLEREVADFDRPPFYESYEAVGVTLGPKVDRWWDVELVPGMLRFWTGLMDAGTGALDGRREGGLQSWHLDAITPKTTTSCYYSLYFMRNYRLGDPAMTHRLYEMTIAVLGEDKAVIEAQQQRLREAPERPLVNIRSDAGQIQGRRLIARWSAS